jgi:hypothetical protein
LGFVITKDRRGSPRKLDLAVASCLAFEARALVIEGDSWRPKPKPRIWNMNEVMANAARRERDAAQTLP